MVYRLNEQLINILIDKKYHSSKELCEILDLKPKKLKNIIEKINLFEDIYIDSKTSKGYILNTTLNDNDLLNIFVSNKVISSEDLILLELLSSNNYIKIENLESKYYFSYSKIYSKIQNLKNDYKIITSRKLGYKLEVDLFKRKINIIEILKEYIKTLNYKKEINFLFSQLDKEVEKYIDLGIEVLKSDALKVKSAVYVDCLLFYILDNIMPIQVHSQDYVLHNILNIPIDKSSEDFWRNYVLKEANENKNIKLSDIFEDIYIQIGIRFTYTQEEYNEFQNHLSSILKYNVHNTFKNEVLVEEFSSKYKMAYEVAIVATKFIETKLNIKLNGMEKLYLAIHFQKLIYNSKSSDKVKVVIVCQYGYAMSSLIAKEVSSYFDDINIHCMQSLKEFMSNEQTYFNKIDIVITTVAGIEAQNTRVIFIDKFEVSKSIEQIRVIKNEVIKNRFRQILKNDFKTININPKTREEAYEQIQEYCLKNKVCIQKYFMSCKEREELGNIVVKQVAHIHGNNNYILKNEILMFELNKEIIWLDEKVKYIFMLSATEEFLKKYNKQIARLYSVISIIPIDEYKDIQNKLLEKFK